MGLFPLKFIILGDGVQDTWLQNMPPCHVDYFKLKEFINSQVQEGFSDLPMKEVIRTSCEKYPLYTRRKGATYFGRQRNTERNLNK